MTNHAAADQYPVFILDDLEENRDAAAEYFSSIGVPVVFATSFEEAKAVLEARDVIFRAYIFDVQVPARDGEEPTDHSAELEHIASANHAHPHIFASGMDELDGHGRELMGVALEASRGFRVFKDDKMSTPKSQREAWYVIWNWYLLPSLSPNLIKAKEKAGWGK